MKKLLILFPLFLSFLFTSNAQNSEKKYSINKTNNEWKKQLSFQEYYVLRESGTERAFTGKFDKFYKKGIYTCKGCDTPLFKSEHKFNSGSGWPSFDKPISKNVAYDTDKELGYIRTEIHCNSCGGHLGHVFNDGPKKTTGKRYCINSASLNFKPEK